jgi:hypothetical protein
MLRTCLIALILTSAVCCSSLLAQDTSVQEPADVKVELRSVTGSNRFQLGEMIPLELLISSTTPNRYLEPCKMFWESCFGYPLCRYVTHWAFDVTPTTGWTDIGWHGCSTMGGPTYEVPSSDLTAEPKIYPYILTTRFRFDSPGTYTVRLSITVGLDDATNPGRKPPNSTIKPNSVTKTAEIVVEIAPAGDAWKKTVIEQGVAAWMAGLPPNAKPQSPEYLDYEHKAQALCNLGTPEAALALVGLLSRGIDTTHCLNNNSNKDVAQAEMGRLLIDPNVGVRPMFFAAYAKLLSRDEVKRSEILAVPPNNRDEVKHSARLAVPPNVVNEVRQTLFASLPKKTPDEMILSLETVLRNPMNGYWVVQGSSYDSHDPYSSEIIAMAAANFDRLTQETQAALLDADWHHLRSPLMLPVVRRRAGAGDGHALLRWFELDPSAATAFMRQEVVRPEPRFSSLYLRLPEESLPAQEQQIAANFMALGSAQELVRAATLLHRYATRATLPTVLPFVDQHMTEWPCELQIPVLAYLLKVSPDDARPRIERVLQKVSPPYCPRGEFFSSLGYMEASPMLDSLAAKQVEDGTSLAADAAEYLGRYGSAAMKSEVWEQLRRWHKRYVESGAKLRMSNSQNTQDDWQLYNLDSRLRNAYVNAQGWTLSPEDVNGLSTLMNDKEKGELACAFNCSSQLGVGPASGNFDIYGRVNGPVFPTESRIDYLMPTESFHYSINQYQCANLKALKQKLLQFPAGSTFSVAHTGSIDDGEGDWTTISTFLLSHGYQFRN